MGMMMVEEIKGRAIKMVKPMIKNQLVVGVLAVAVNIVCNMIWFPNGDCN
jgi:hypothetical protein